MGTKVVGTLALLAQAMGPVGYHDAGYLQSFKLRQMPKIFAGAKIDFFRQRHLCDQGLRLSTQCGIKGVIHEASRRSKDTLINGD